MAELTGLSKGHLSRFERGEKALSVAALMRLAQALGTSVSALLGETVDKDAIHLVRFKDASCLCRAESHDVQRICAHSRSK